MHESPRNVALAAPSRRFTRTGIETVVGLEVAAAGGASPRAAGSPEQELRPDLQRALRPLADLPRAAGSPEQELRPIDVLAHRYLLCASPSRRFTRTGIETAARVRTCPASGGTPSRRFTRTGIETGARWCAPGCARAGPRAAGSPEQELRLEQPRRARRVCRGPEPQVHQNRN